MTPLRPTGCSRWPAGAEPGSHDSAKIYTAELWRVHCTVARVWFRTGPAIQIRSVCRVAGSRWIRSPAQSVVIWSQRRAGLALAATAAVMTLPAPDTRRMASLGETERGRDCFTVSAASGSRRSDGRYCDRIKQAGFSRGYT